MAMLEMLVGQASHTSCHKAALGADQMLLKMLTSLRAGSLHCSPGVSIQSRCCYLIASRPTSIQLHLLSLKYCADQ
jgi:hypothetical protein